MKLEKEWEVGALMLQIYLLCGTAGTTTGTIEDGAHNPLWVDQLCIRQNDISEVRDTLARIPDIFRSSETISLSPGSQCKCLEKGLTTLKENSKDMATLMKVIKDAYPGLLSIRGWSSRIQTRQELIYAKNFRTV